MRLFIIESDQGGQWEQLEQRLVINIPRIVRHAQVVRLQVGEEVSIQVVEDGHTTVRYGGVVEEIGKRQIIVKIQLEQSAQSEQQ
jgi:hypothetical protein